MRRITSLILGTLLFFIAGCAAGESAPDTDAGPDTGPDAEPDADPVTYGPPPDVMKATITMEDGGVIELELYPNLAPQTVRNFVYLARQGFYDGLKFHRIIKGFMIQGGCPDGSGGGNPGYAIKGEFAENGFPNNLKHTRGVLSTARASSGYDTAGSQFFIMDSNNAGLDGKYAAFGKVTEGMDVVDKIADTPSSGSPSGTVKPEDMPVIKSIVINDDTPLPEPDKLKR